MATSPTLVLVLALVLVLDEYAEDENVGEDEYD
jgi:hypothetical protein